MTANIEIERKFLVRDMGWMGAATGKPIRQGYIAYTGATVVRVRQKGDHGFITVKAGKDGLARHEFEYEIPVADARRMLELLSLKPPIEKTRYHLDVGGFTWDVDVFEGANAGLIVAEVELTHEDQDFPRPDWVGPEVSGDPRFFNAYLAERPFGRWGVLYDDLLNDCE